MKNYSSIGMLVLLSGISWAQCATGTPGTNCSGPLNVQPQSGNTGQSAITFVDLGLPVPAPGGGQYTLSIAGGILQESDNGNSYHSLVGSFGPQGATGPAGPQGTQGAQGPTGLTGPSGSAGAIGATGPVGAQGTTGSAGPSGPAGTTGAAGPVGAQGLTGLTGPSGPAGATGAAGPVGAQGLTGLTGPSGPAGATGAVGPVGVQGLTGLTGPSGPAGATGATGPVGVQGLAGPIGPSGLTGATGAAGPVGAQGLTGPIGPSGPAGAIGAIGPAGATGLAGAQGTLGATGPAGPQGPPGSLAAPPDYSFYNGDSGFKAVVGSNEVGGTFDRDQIDMLSATSVRFVITMAASVLPSGSYAEAEYTPDGTNWYALSGEVPVTSPDGTYTSGWQGLPTGANGDYLVRTIVFNAGTTAAQVGVRQLHLQFK